LDGSFVRSGGREGPLRYTGELEETSAGAEPPQRLGGHGLASACVPARFGLTMIAAALALVGALRSLDGERSSPRGLTFRCPG